MTRLGRLQPRQWPDVGVASTHQTKRAAHAWHEIETDTLRDFDVRSVTGEWGATRDDPDQAHRITSMSIEGAALILALLWGPTALWLIVRAARGPGSSRPDSFVDAGASSQQAQDAPDMLLLEYWVCTDCRSVNHLGAMRCYGCGTDRAPMEPAAPATPDPLPTGTSWVPVMDAATDRHAAEPVAAMLRTAALASAPVHDVSPPELDAVPAAAVAATAASGKRRSRATGRASAARAPATLADASVAAHTATAAPVIIGPADGAPVRPTRRRARSTEPAVPRACPFLGFKDDPTTRCDYADARNVCHAAAAAAASSGTVAGRLRRGGRGGRSASISPAHQASLCLTANHQQCERYPKAAPAKGSA